MTTETPELSLFTRLWLAFTWSFRVLFDADFAARVWTVRDGPALPRPTTVLPEPSKPSTPPSPAVDTVAALQLLSLLQREGRLIDFLEQDITGYSDVEVGVAARVVHEGCRKALRAHAVIEPVRAEQEETRVILETGFDADAIKLVGDVKGHPPYGGVLRHRGWRARRLELPTLLGGHDAQILAPAEVELG